MDITEELESTLFYFGFQQCRKKENLNFLKLNDKEYLLMKIFKKADTADLFYAKFSVGDNPCSAEPYFEKIIKLSFSPNKDGKIIKDILEKYK